MDWPVVNQKTPVSDSPSSPSDKKGSAKRAEDSIRIATFNIAMNRKKSGELEKELKDGSCDQAKKIAEIIQRVRPDVILLCELDESLKCLDLFHDKYLTVAQGEQKPIKYKHRFTAEVNTGVPTGIDLNGDGKSDGPEDAFGYGAFPGQYSIAVLSRFPIDRPRTFQKFLWKDMPDVTWPVDPKTKKSYYSDKAKKVFRISSKSHWDLPIQIGDKTIHFLVCHPTPPVFDGPEDRNGIRNADEIRFWSDYIDGKSYFVDDKGGKGGLPDKAAFVIAGDLNADPNDGDSANDCIENLLKHRLVNGKVKPESKGGVEASKKSKGKNLEHRGDPKLDTGDFNDRSVGNLRIDYVAPSRNLKVVGSGVFWPESGKPGAKLVKASDHRLVWIDVSMKK